MGMYFRARLGLKIGEKNDIFWSERGSGIGEPGGTYSPGHREFFEVFPPPPPPQGLEVVLCSAYHHTIFDTPNWHL